MLPLYFLQPTIYANTEEYRYNVLVKDNVSIDFSKQSMEEQGIKVLDEIPELKLLTISSSDDRNLLEETNKEIIADIIEDSTLSIKPNFTFTFDGEIVEITDGIASDYQWDIHQLSGEEHYLSPVSNGSAVIGVIDSGISHENMDIGVNVISSQNFTVDSETGVVNENDIIDQTGHGTSIVSQMSSFGAYIGVYPGIKTRMYKVFEDGNSQVQWILKAIIQAAKDDVDVINLSLGEYLLKDSSSAEDKTTLVNIYQKAINYAYKKGTVVVASVGNDGIDLTNTIEVKHKVGELTGKYISSEDGIVLDIPSQLNNIVTVGSVNRKNEISSFSNYGNGIVDIYAPGGGKSNLIENGYASWRENRDYQIEWILIPTVNGGFTYTYGSSLAAAKVSAALGIIIEKFNLKNRPEEAINVLLEHSKIITDVNESTYRVLSIKGLV